jgi:hypothetical protein
MLQSIRSAKHASTTGASTDLNFKEHFQQSLDFAVTEPEFFVEQRHCSVDVRTKLSGGCTDGIGGLQFVPALDVASASTAKSGVDIELSINDGARNLGLVLNERFGFRDFIMPAFGTARWQRNIVGFVNFLRHSTTVVLAMIVAALTTRLLRISFTFLAKRSGLAFSLAFNLLKPFAQAT